MKRQTRSDPISTGDAERLGQELQDARLALGLRIEDVAAFLRIRVAYLEALEAGRLHDLPAPAYVLGYLRLYAGALGLEAEDVAQRFRETVGPMARRRGELIFPEPVPERGVPAGAAVLAGAVLVLGVYAGWYAWSGSDTRSVDTVPALPPALEQVAQQGRVPTAPAASPSSPAAASAPAAPFLLPPSPNATPTSAAAATAAVSGLSRPALPPSTDAAAPVAATVPLEPGRVVLRARAEAWVQVRAGQGGPVLINRVLQPGEIWTVPAREGLLLSTGNAGGLEILVDGQPVAGLGGARAVRREVPIDPERLKAGPIPPPQ